MVTIPIVSRDNSFVPMYLLKSFFNSMTAFFYPYDFGCFIDIPVE